MTMHLKQTFEAVILTEKYPKSQIDIYVEVSFKGSGILFYFLFICKWYLGFTIRW
jgi:ribonuclease PH